MGIELDKDIASTMTDEELEAINADASPDELIVMRQQAEADKLDDEDGDEEEGASESEAESEAKPVIPAAKPDDEAPDEKIQDFKPSYQATLPADFDDQVKAVDDDFKALAKEFKDGNLETDDYDARLADLNQRRRDLDRQQIKAELLGDINAQNEQQSRAWTADQFAAKVKSEIDYQKDTAKVADFVAFSSRIESDPANAGKPFEWVLQEAHKRVCLLHGIQNVAAPTPQKTIKEAKEGRKPPPVPQTLANVPGADGPGDIASEFVDLDGLEGLDFETAIAKMTPAQRERYLKAA